MDIDLTIEAVEAIRDELSRLDPDGADHYRRARRGLHRGTAGTRRRRSVSSSPRLPEERRYLVTFHDAYGYFADRYGLTILGFVVEGPEEEPSASDHYRAGGEHRPSWGFPTSSANRSSAPASSSRSPPTPAQPSVRFRPGPWLRSIQRTWSSSEPSQAPSPSEDAAPVARAREA